MKISPNSFEYNLFLTLIIIILGFKLTLAIYLFSRSYKKIKETKQFTFDFLFSMFVVMTCLFISRLLYMIYDFYLTQFDTSTAHLQPTITVWKFAALTANIGFIVVLFIIDKKVINFRFKGVLAYITAVAALIQFIYPVDSQEDFAVVSTIGLIGNIAGIAVPLIFLYVGIKTPGLRKTAFIIAFGVIIYVIGSNLAVEPILAPIRESYGLTGVITLYFIFFTLKIIGLSMFTYGFINFKI